MTHSSTNIETESSQIYSYQDILKKLYVDIDANTPCDKLSLILHAFMLESGYIPKDVPDFKKYECMPKNWNLNSIYKIQYHHKTCPEVFCWMTCVPMYTMLTVHGTHQKIEAYSGPQMVLKCQDHLSGKESSDILECYRHVDDLERKFKDGFCYRLLSDIQSVSGVMPTFGLGGLIEELKFRILQYLPMKSLVAMSAVNKEFNSLSNIAVLWKNLFTRDFCDAESLDQCSGSLETHNWKELYKKQHMKRKETVKSQIIYRPMYLPPSILPRYIANGENDVDANINLDPDIQRHFPQLRDRFRQPRGFDNLFPRGSPSFFQLF